ncbi:MAG: hypothetical protein NW201_03450 [Gemmatimonadales bacterium]|nr:hypothetical protein [Gemmatimonadales bacterium]
MATGAAAQSQSPAQWAGAGYLTRAADIHADFPLLVAADSLARGSGGAPQATFAAALARRGVPLSGDLGARPGPALALAFDAERRIRMAVAGGERASVLVTGQVLRFDFATALVEHAYPFSLEYIDVPAPGSDGRAELVRGLGALLAADGDNGALGRLAAEYAARAAGARSRCRVRFDAVDGLADDAADDTRRPEARRRLAELFVKHWVSTVGMAVLPSENSEVLGGRMAARFADGRVLTLELPPPDFVVRLDSLRHSRREVARNPAVRVEALGASVLLRIARPGAAKPVYEDRLRLTVADTLAVLAEDRDERRLRLRAVSALAAGIARAVAQRDLGWLRRQSSRGGDAGRDLLDWAHQVCGA